MPPTCIICGQPFAAIVSKQFVWKPKWASLGFSLLICTLIPALVIMIVGAFHTKRMTVECPMCERHRNYWAWRGFWTIAPLLVLTVFTVVLAISALNGIIPGPVFPILFVATAAFLAIWGAAALIVHRSSLKAIAITDDDITLESVHAAFLDQVRLERARMKGRRADADFDDYEPYPRKPA